MTDQPRAAAAYDRITDAWSLAVSCDDFVYRLHKRGYEISPIAQARPAVASEGLQAALERLRATLIEDGWVEGSLAVSQLDDIEAAL